MKSIAIVGAGIAGLSIAHAIRKLAPEVRVIVLERGQRAGGNIRSELTKGYLCEWGPDGFLDNAPETLALARQWVWSTGCFRAVMQPGAGSSTGMAA